MRRPNQQRPAWFYQVYNLYIAGRFLWPLGGYPLHRGKILRPFFIIGSGRSGNTLMRRILTSHSQLHIPPESYVLGRTIRLFQRYRRLPWPDLVTLVLGQFEFHPQFETFEISLRSLAQEAKEWPKQKRSLAALCDALYRYHAAQHQQSCQRWGDKTPANTFFLNLLYKLFPQAQYIHMLRDGADVVVSYVQAGLYQSLLEAAERWKDAVTIAAQFANHHPTRCLLVRYESLVQEPTVTTQAVCAFLEVPYEPTMLAVGNQVAGMGDVTRLAHHTQVQHPISAAHIGKGRHSLTAEQRTQLGPLMNNSLQQWGYEPL